MRVCNRTLTKLVSTSIVAVSESLVSIIEQKNNNTIEVVVNCLDSNSTLIKTETYNITGSKYTLLMSANPSFAPGKPANEYREVDIWYIIDLMRAG